MNVPEKCTCDWLILILPTNFSQEYFYYYFFLSFLTKINISLGNTCFVFSGTESSSPFRKIQNMQKKITNTTNGSDTPLNIYSIIVFKNIS